MNFKIYLFLSFIDLIYSQDYNYYVLAVQKWCTKNYQIHGLWPQYSPNIYPSYCMNTQYFPPKDELKYQMNKYWSSCNNTDLWEHEWIKHGTCILKENDISEFNYFNLTISLFKNNLNLINSCLEENCRLACFDLNFNIIKCPN